VSGRADLASTHCLEWFCVYLGAAMSATRAQLAVGGGCSGRLLTGPPRLYWPFTAPGTVPWGV
jgi:hypothetical protein